MGRPPKYPENKSNSDFEKTKYISYFNQIGRSPDNGNKNDFNVLPLIQEAYNFIYESYISFNHISKPKNFNDIPVLLNLTSRNIANKPNYEKTCDEAFTEYLISFMNKTNKTYFLFMLKFILLFREFYNISKNIGKKDEEKKEITNYLPPNQLPDSCNEFYSDYLKINDFFGLNEDEIVEIIQHFCIWLFKNNFTKSKLSLAS